MQNQMTVSLVDFDEMQDTAVMILSYNDKHVATIDYGFIDMGNNQFDTSMIVRNFDVTVAPILNDIDVLRIVCTVLYDALETNQTICECFTDGDLIVDPALYLGALASDGSV